MAINPYTQSAQQELINTFVPIDYKTIGDAQQEIQKQNDIAAGQLELFRDKKINFLNQDAERAQALNQLVLSEVDKIIEDSKGDYRKYNPQIKALKRKVGDIFDKQGGEGYAIQQSYNNFLEYSKQLNDAYKKGDITKEQLELENLSLQRYKGVGKGDSFGRYNSFQGEDYAQYVDIDKKAQDLAEGWKADGLATGQLKNAGNGMLVNVKGEIVSFDEVYSNIKNSLKNDPKINAYVNQLAYLKTYKNIDPESGSVVVGDKYFNPNIKNQIAESLIEAPVRTAANKVSYIKKDFDFMKDPNSLNALEAAQLDLINAQKSQLQPQFLQSATYENPDNPYKQIGDLKPKDLFGEINTYDVQKIAGVKLVDNRVTNPTTGIVTGNLEYLDSKGNKITKEEYAKKISKVDKNLKPSERLKVMADSGDMFALETLKVLRGKPGMEATKLAEEASKIYNSKKQQFNAISFQGLMIPTDEAPRVASDIIRNSSAYTFTPLNKKEGKQGSLTYDQVLEENNIKLDPTNSTSVKSLENFEKSILPMSRTRKGTLVKINGVDYLIRSNNSNDLLNSPGLTVEQSRFLAPLERLNGISTPGIDKIDNVWTGNQVNNNPVFYESYKKDRFDKDNNYITTEYNVKEYFVNPDGSKEYLRNSDNEIIVRPLQEINNLYLQNNPFNNSTLNRNFNKYTQTNIKSGIDPFNQQ